MLPLYNADSSFAASEKLPGNPSKTDKEKERFKFQQSKTLTVPRPHHQGGGNHFFVITPSASLLVWDPRNFAESAETKIPTRMT